MPVWAACDVENHSSARALEKAGLSREGILPQFSVHPNISPVVSKWEGVVRYQFFVLCSLLSAVPIKERW